MISDYCCSTMSFKFGLQVLYNLSVSPTHASLARRVGRGGWLLLHDIPIMRGGLHYRQDGRRNYKSTQGL